MPKGTQLGSEEARTLTLGTSEPEPWTNQGRESDELHGVGTLHLSEVFSAAPFLRLLVRTSPELPIHALPQVGGIVF